jgi:hypothetical protein
MEIQEKRKSHTEILEEIIRQTLREKFGREPTKANQEKDLILGALLKTGKISIAYIMRKFNCTLEDARKKIHEATKHKCSLWDNEEISYFDPEFEVCNCFASDAT